LIGYPIKKSLSPAMHNAAFKKLKIEAVYCLYEAPADSISKAIKTLKFLGVNGANVTIPHKQACMRYLDSISKEAKLIGAVNTIVSKGRRLIGHNTDGIGFLKAVKNDLGFTPKGKRIFLLGAGGAARAVATSLCLKGAAAIYIVDKIKTQANSLKRALKKNFPKCEVKVVDLQAKALLKEVDLLVNATPIGMNAKDALLVNPAILKRGAKVYDLVYSPARTKLVKAALKRGLKASGGLSMLLYQGVAAFELWTNKRAPVPVMRRALR